jgi:hypothetical protein
LAALFAFELNALQLAALFAFELNAKNKKYLSLSNNRQKFCSSLRGSPLGKRFSLSSMCPEIYSFIVAVLMISFR